MSGVESVHDVDGADGARARGAVGDVADGAAGAGRVSDVLGVPPAGRASLHQVDRAIRRPATRANRAARQRNLLHLHTLSSDIDMRAVDLHPYMLNIVFAASARSQADTGDGHTVNIDSELQRLSRIESVLAIQVDLPAREIEAQCIVQIRPDGLRQQIFHFEAPRATPAARR